VAGKRSHRNLPPPPDPGQTADGERLDAEETRVEEEVEDAVRFAEASPNPAPEELFRDIYVEPVG
jgi:pyruvate dehydrogenase E1 component alpha subunit